jgi:predicted dehydrogenase
MSIADGERIQHAAAKSSQQLMVGHLMLYHPAVQKLRNVVRSGELGTLRYLYATRVNLGTVRREENAWWSLAPHDLSMILDLVGMLPERIAVHGAAYLTPGVEDVIFAHLVFPGGIVASIHVSWLDPHKRRELTVVGDRKMVSFDDVEPGEKLRIYDKGADVKSEFTSFAEFVALRHGDVSIPRLQAIEPLQAELEHFAEAMATSTPPYTSLASGLDVVRILEAGQRSLQSGGLPVMIG